MILCFVLISISTAGWWPCSVTESKEEKWKELLELITTPNPGNTCMSRTKSLLTCRFFQYTRIHTHTAYTHIRIHIYMHTHRCTHIYTHANILRKNKVDWERECSMAERRGYVNFISQKMPLYEVDISMKVFFSIFKLYYCCSITVVCIFSPPLYPTPLMKVLIL